MDTIPVKRTCPMCGKTTIVTVNKKGFEAWQKDTLIQRALPELSATDREILISGMCPECQEDFF